MAYISNTTKGGTPYFNVSSLLTGGRKPSAYTKSNTNFNTDLSKLTIGSQADAMKQEFGLPTVSPAWKEFGSQFQIGADGNITKKTDVNTDATYKGTNGVVSNPTTSTTTLPYNGGGQSPDLRGLITGLQGLSTSLGSYAQGQKGLLTPPEPTQPSQFSQFLTGLQGLGTPSKDQQRYLRNLEKTAQSNAAIGRDARATSDMYGNEIARVGKLGAGAVAGARSTGTDVVGRGNANIAAESASNRMNALSAGLTAELQGTQQQLTGASQAANAFNNALTGANMQQQLGISAMGQGAQIAAPSPAQYGQTVFDPASGQYVGGNLDPQQQAQSLAQQVINGQMTYDQALASLGYAGQAGTNFLNNAITGQGGNALQLQAQGAGQQANISTQTTAGTDIARQGLGQATQDYVQMNTAAQFANQQASAVSNILAQTGLNEISSTDYNKALNSLKGRFSDTNFAALNTALQEAQIAYTNLLSTGGGTPSGREAAAINTLNINQSAGAINASIQELESAVARRLQAQYSAVQQYNTNLGGGTTMGGGTGSVWDW